MILSEVNKNDNNKWLKKYGEMECFQEENLAFVSSKIFYSDELRLFSGNVDVIG